MQSWLKRLQDQFQHFLGVPSVDIPSVLASVVSIHECGDEVKYDMHVPGDECYLGNGIWCHNTGLGKSFIELEFARQCAEETGKPSLILTPLAVAGQMVREGQKFGIDARQIREQHEVGSGVMVANYERLAKLDPQSFGAVVLDECFAAGTPITVIDHNGNLAEQYIENIQIGDRILNAAGVDRVSDVHRREVPYAIRIKVAGSVFISSPNHPIFTQRGWTAAQYLRPGDRALGTSAAMRMVRGKFFTEVPGAASWQVLRSVLLSEMADEPAGDIGESAHAGNSCETWGETLCMVEVGQSESLGGNGQNNRAQSVSGPRSAGQNIPPIESHEARTFRAWGQWSWNDGTSGVHEGCTWRRLDSGICFVTGATDTGLSDALQDGFGVTGLENLYRGGWSIPRQPQGSGSEENGSAGFSWVESIEVLKPGHPDLERLRDASGKLYFYDLGGTRHPSFTVCGFLVHNSSILKSYAGRTRAMIQDAFIDTPYKLAATATPSPNDHTELGNHAEFLGVMRQQEMLSKWFINDTSTASQDWRLKGHAVEDFWSFVASWSRCATLPSDLGGDDAGYILPDVDRRIHTVAADRMEKVADGMLFRIPEMSATSFHEEKRLTLKQRCEMAADLATHDKPVTVWCETNDESTTLAKMIPGAIEVRGDLDPDEKERRILSFIDGTTRVMVTKPKLAGFGLNLQHCAHAVFASISFSYEQHYQAVRRSHRFGQSETVRNDIVISDTEASIWDVINVKSKKHDEMKRRMAEAMKSAQTNAKRRVVYDRPLDLAFPEWVRTGS